MNDATPPNSSPAFFTGDGSRTDTPPTEPPVADFVVADPVKAAASAPRSAAAYDAVDRQLGKAADLLETAAEFVDDRFGATEAGADEAGAASRRVSGTMRKFAHQVRAQDSRELADRARTAAARHPVYTLGIGAAIGAIAIGILTRGGGKDRA